MNDKQITTDKVGEIEKVIVRNIDGTEEEIKQAMVIDYSLKDGEIGMGIRFHNLDMQDIDNIFGGFRKILK